jgi:hypothetical protein
MVGNVSNDDAPNNFISSTISSALPDMAATLPQFHKNNLQPVEIERLELRDVLLILQAAVRRGVDLLKSERPVPDPASDATYGSISHGDLGRSSDKMG